MRKYGLDKVHDAIVTDELAGGHLKLVLMEESENDWSTSINAYMVAEGLATLKNLGDAPDDVQAWAEFEDEARQGQLGLWKDGN